MSPKDQETMYSIDNAIKILKSIDTKETSPSVILQIVKAIMHLEDGKKLLNRIIKVQNEDEKIQEGKSYIVVHKTLGSFTMYVSEIAGELIHGSKYTRLTDVEFSNVPCGYEEPITVRKSLCTFTKLKD